MNETWLTILGMIGAVAMACLTAGVLFGRLFQRVDTIEKDLNAAHAEIRKLKTHKECEK